jgi:hypothetical protein
MIAFLSFRALAVTTSITRIYLESKQFLEKRSLRREGLAMVDGLGQVIIGDAR